MSYFDSPKNRAIWEKRLSVLREERGVREANGFRPVEKQNTEEKLEVNPYRKRIGLEGLEKRVAEQGVRRVKRPTRQNSRTMERERTHEKAPEKKGKGMAM